MLSFSMKRVKFNRIISRIFGNPLSFLKYSNINLVSNI